MAPKLLLWSIQILAVTASTHIRDAFEFHQKRQTPAQALSACSVVYQVLTACESLTPGYTALPSTSQAPCACYYIDRTTTAWLPNIFDNAVATCASYARTVEPAVYSGLQRYNGLCNRVGDLRTVPAPGGGSPAPAACANLASAFQYCNSAIPGLSTMGASSSARCLCYDKTTWLPNGFDGAIATCAAYAKTASPSDYAVLQPLQGFCNAVGDVLKPANVPAAPTPSNPVVPTPPVIVDSPSITPVVTPAVTPTPTLTGIATFPACSTVGSAIYSCESNTPGFTTLAASRQASCVCYTRRTSWIPEVFDDAVTSCADHVKTASPSDYPIFSNLAGFCSDVGDIYATTSQRSSTRSVSGGVGIGGGGMIFGDSTSTTSSPAPARTVTAPGPATPTSSRAFAVPTAAAGGWVTRIVAVVVLVQALG